MIGRGIAEKLFEFAKVHFGENGDMTTATVEFDVIVPKGAPEREHGREDRGSVMGGTQR
jgi:hypothetical protein